MKPILKWAGGKRAVLNDLLKNIPEKFNKYYEPFLGSGTLFFALEPKKAVIADINSELINFYNVLTYAPESLIFHLQLYENNKEYYYKLRDLDKSSYYLTMDNVQKAARFLYLNKTCYNGLYRVNKNNQFNVPFGKYKKPNFCDKKTIYEISNFLICNKIYIYKGDYKHTTRTASPGDFIYLDPPYYNSYNQYTSDVFEDYRHLELKNYLDDLTERGIKAMISNSNEDYIKDIYSHYKITILDIKRSVNPKSKNKNTTELLIMNY